MTVSESDGIKFAMTGSAAESLRVLADSELAEIDSTDANRDVSATD